MNRLFLRLVLNVTHMTDKNTYALGEWAARWNTLLVSIGFSMMCPMLWLTEDEFMVPIAVTILVVYLWFICLNAWFFHRMHKKKMRKEAKRRTRWMLNATPYCFGGAILWGLALVLDSPQEYLLINLSACIMFSFFVPYSWIVIATRPFHMGYGR